MELDTTTEQETQSIDAAEVVTAAVALEPVRTRKLASALDGIDTSEPEVVEDPVRNRYAEAAEKITGVIQGRQQIGMQLLKQFGDDGIETILPGIEAIAERIGVLELILDGDGDAVTPELMEEASEEYRKTWQPAKRYRLMSLKDLTGPRRDAMHMLVGHTRSQFKDLKADGHDSLEILQGMIAQGRFAEFLSYAYGPVGEKYRHEDMAVVAPKLSGIISNEMIVGILYRFFTSTRFSTQHVLSQYILRKITPILSGLLNGGKSVNESELVKAGDSPTVD